tara:strand:- start:3230 stop:3469 length:240 start_codon:yes stop_codon:yes gene_type:complete
MNIIENFGTRKTIHVAFIVNAKYRRRAGAFLDIFVEANISKDGVEDIILRENGSRDRLSLKHLDQDKLYELIIKQANEI